jgi:hypothetical protein
MVVLLARMTLRVPPASMAKAVKVVVLEVTHGMKPAPHSIKADVPLACVCSIMSPA